MNIPIMFHYFHNQKFKKYGQGSISEEDLINLIKKIGRDNILDIDTWLNKYSKGELKEKETCFTIDDGLKCQYEVALPILKKYKIKAGWYIYTNPLNEKYEILDIYKYFCGTNYDSYDDFYTDFYKLINNFEKIKEKFEDINYLSDDLLYSYNDRLFRYIRDIVLKKEQFKKLIFKMIENKGLNLNDLVKNIWMNKNEIIELSKTQLIGLHTCNHPTRIDLLSEKDQYNEYNDCKEILEKIICKKISTLTYPCGNYNNDTFDICRKIDIDYAFIADTRSINKNNKCFLIQREDSSITKNKLL